MGYSWRQIRLVFLLQVAIVSLVVLLCMLVLAALGGELMPLALPALATILIALAAIAGATWLAWRATRRTLAPVDWILGEVLRWDPRRPDPQAFAPARIPADLPAEPRRLADALHGLGQRMEDCLLRERDFTRAASHELRTPLTVIRIAADLLDGEPDLPPRARRQVERIQFAGTAMHDLVDALLLLARDEAVVAEAQDVAVRAVAEAALARLRPELEGRPLELVGEYHAAPQLHAPPRALAVILDKLLDNAARYTAQGRITLQLHADRLEIADTGSGMDAELLARACEPFRRGAEASTGPGLGLAIAHRLAQRCGWRLALASAPGHGTRAVLWFAPEAAA